MNKKVYDFGVVQDYGTDDPNSLIKDKRDKLDSVNQKLDVSVKELEDLKEGAGFCPFCGTVFEGGYTHVE